MIKPDDNDFTSSRLSRSVRAALAMDSEVPEGGAMCVTSNQKPFALFKVGGKVYCLDNTCTHLGGPLCQGRLQGTII